jgi:hypothetical protein
MKIRTSIIALAALAALGSAQAMTPAQIDAARSAGTLKEVYITGASALRLALGGYMQELAQAGSFDTFFFANTSGADHRAYSLTLNKAIGSWPVGTQLLVVKRDKGGSGQGVTPLLSPATAVVAGVDGDGAGQVHMLVNGSCTASTGTSPATDIQKPGFICTATTQRFAHAGLSDVEPKLLQTVVNGGTGLSTTNLDAAGFVQNVFGVAVNKTTYLALQKAQGLVATSATVIDEDAAKQPTLSSNFVAGALTGSVTGNNSSPKGWGLVIPAAVDSSVASKQVNVCRRANGSGTQAASNVFFLNNPCAGGVAVGPTAASTSGAIAVAGRSFVQASSSTSTVEACLGTTVENLGAYGLAVIGRENNPRAVVAGVATDRGYRFVKINGVAPERANVIDGSYGFVFESTMQWPVTGQANRPAVDVLSFLADLRTNMGKSSVLQGLDVDLQAGLVAVPVAGSWLNLSATDKLFTAHTSRVAGNSCTPSRMK